MKDETGKITFDQDEQAEIDRIVQDRLGREKSKYADYEDLKGTLDELNAFGFQGSAKEVKEAVKAQREEVQRQQSLQDSMQEVKSQIKEEGTSPELVAMLASLQKDIKDSKAEIAELKKEKNDKILATKQAEQLKTEFDAKVAEFNETYPDVDLDKLNEDEDFIDFVQTSNPNLSLVKVYERYDKYVNGSTNKAVAKIQSNLERSTSSGKQKNNRESFGLSADQRKTVDDWNKSNPKMKITYQEFSDNLRR